MNNILVLYKGESEYITVRFSITMWDKHLSGDWLTDWLSSIIRCTVTSIIA